MTTYEELQVDTSFGKIFVHVRTSASFQNKIPNFQKFTKFYSIFKIFFGLAVFVVAALNQNWWYNVAAAVTVTLAMPLLVGNVGKSPWLFNFGLLSTVSSKFW
jgi:hypothetical protein